MKVSFDPTHNVAYIALKEKGAEVETLRLSDDVLLDIGPDGALYGIELLNANEQLGDNGNSRILSLINESTGQVAQVELPR